MIRRSGLPLSRHCSPVRACTMGCNFCTTSAFFGGKGKFLNFYDTGEELFQVMCEVEKALKMRYFFIMDENFLLHRKRALELLALMREKKKNWGMYVFSSINALSKYTMEELVGLGVCWVWVGLEGAESKYAKREGVDTLRFTRELQKHGIKVLASTPPLPTRSRSSRIFLPPRRCSISPRARPSSGN